MRAAVKDTCAADRAKEAGSVNRSIGLRTQLFTSDTGRHQDTRRVKRRNGMT